MKGGARKFRVVRPSDDLDALLPFYRDGLGFEVVFRFEDKDGFDGLILSYPGAPYHLAFTRRQGHVSGRAPTEENLLVLFLPDRGDWERAVARMVSAGFDLVEPFNPYWKANGATFEDPDGYRVVLQNAEWRDGD